MGKTKIEWTRGDDGTPGATWNPIRGCSLVSAGCTNCYAMKQAHRFSGPGQAYEGLTRLTSNGSVWTGAVRVVEEHLRDPIRWRRPRRIFVNSMSDLFHESLPDEVIDRVFAVMALSPQHTFQVLTKRAERMMSYLNGKDYKARHFTVESLRLDGAEARRSDIRCEIVKIGGREKYDRIGGLEWPLPNVWLGVSAEDQETADERIPWLLKTPAAIRWISYEPALGPIDFTNLRRPPDHRPGFFDAFLKWTLDGRASTHIDWVVCGGESGPDARPMHPNWARSVRDQCIVAGVKFFFKQWGNWMPVEFDERHWPESHSRYTFDAQTQLENVGKKAAGRLLDGVYWNQYPENSEE